MKTHHVGNIFLCLFLMFLLLVVTACSSREDTEENFHIGISQCSDDDWRSKMNEEIRRELTFNRGVSVEFRSADDDSEKQVADINYFIEQNVDLIVVAPNTATTVVPAIERALQKDIPVVLVDRNINREGATAFIGADNYEIGYKVGEYVAARLNHKGRVVEIAGLCESSPAQDRHKGFTDALKPEIGGVNVVATIYTDWTQRVARERMNELLDSIADIDLVFAHNDRMAMGAQEAMEARYPGNDVLFIGVDALTGEGLGVEAVRDSILDASFIYPTRGDKVLELALKILRQEPYEKNISLPSALVDASNAGVMLMQSKSLDEQMAKIEWLDSQIDDFWRKYSAQQMFLWACVVFIILTLVLLFVVMRFYSDKVRANRLLEQQTVELEEKNRELELQREQVKTATAAKLSFFTNVSHDFRTPLTLIADPVSLVKDSPRLNEEEQTLMRIANKNINILLRLVNQVLDLRKYENGKMELSLANADIKECVTEWVASFRQLSIKKHIHLLLSIEESDNYMMAFDAEKMERIVFNLLSNAFKFTPENGTVSVRLSTYEHNVVLTVKDTGIGIPDSMLSKIFDNFYQIDSKKEESSGIGLALVKSFVELHGGNISAQSESGKGSTFICSFPKQLVDEEVVEAQTIISADRVADELGEIEMPEITVDEQVKPIVLVIDDNKDMRTLIRTLLHDDFMIVEATNGRQGITLVNKYLPDLVICDVMMPVMDGFECCKIIKEEMRTSHIPVLMLTACSFDEQRITSYESGADAFLAKPFDAKVLLSRVQALVDNRKRIKDFFSDRISIVATTSDDEKLPSAKEKDIDMDFLGKLKRLINEQMADSELNVETLGEQMGLSRVQLYRKVKALTNYSPVELLRIMRLKRAQDLISTHSTATIAEISYQVGFSSPSYFAKCYKDYFGESPGVTQQRIS